MIYMENDYHDKAMATQIMEAGGRMKYIRKLLKISQRDFAASVGMSQGHLCVIEKQERPPTDTLLKAICYQYKMNEEWLLTGKGEPFTSFASNRGIPVFSQIPENYPEIIRVGDVVGYLSLAGLPKDGFAIYQRGDYMSPTVQALDLVICEPSCSEIVSDDLVLVKNKWKTCIIRRLRKVDGKMIFTADNPAYNAFELKELEQNVVAKVVKVLRNVNI
jgi:repressor LexA